MIGLDFGILFSLKAEVEGSPASAAGFQFVPASTTRDLLDRLQAVARSIDDQFMVFASDVFGIFAEETVGTTKPFRLKEINLRIEGRVYISVSDSSIHSLIDSTFRPSDLAVLQALPPGFKWMYYVDSASLPAANPIGQSSIVGLAPPVLSIQNSRLGKIAHVASGKTLQPFLADDVRSQFNFGLAEPGLYQLTLINPSVNRKFYADPAIFSRPPLAVVEVRVPKGTVSVKQHNIVFKKRP
ncbi:MAG: hypothetical protein AAF587_33015 [Bacteroidota bacterium]